MKIMIGTSGKRAQGTSIEDLFRRCLEESGEAWDELYRLLLSETGRHVQNIFRRFSLARHLDEHLDNAVNYVFGELYISRHEFAPERFAVEFRFFRRKTIIRYMNREIAFHRRFVTTGSSGDEQRGQACAGTADPEREYLEFMDLVRLLDRLPPKYGLVCKLRLIEDLSFADISGMLRINESTARTRFVRGMDQIKKRLVKA